MTARVKSALVLLAVFMLGGAAGAGLMRTMETREWRRDMGRPPAEARAQLMLRAMSRHLDLTADQHSRIKAILEASELEFEGEMAACRPGVERARGAVDAKIREVLEPDQQAQFDAMQQRMRDRRGPPPGGGRPHPPGRRHPHRDGPPPPPPPPLGD